MRDYAEVVKALRCFNVNYDSNKLTNDAADAIEELLAAVPKWISVEERLPELTQQIEDDSFLIDYSEDVLVLRRKTCSCEVCRLVVDLGKTKWEDRMFDEITGVTHWMPLPEPPKEVE